jgi:hypothetical protein
MRNTPHHQCLNRSLYGCHAPFASYCGTVSWSVHWTMTSTLNKPFLVMFHLGFAHYFIFAPIRDQHCKDSKVVPSRSLAQNAIRAVLARSGFADPFERCWCGWSPSVSQLLAWSIFQLSVTPFRLRTSFDRYGKVWTSLFEEICLRISFSLWFRSTQTWSDVNTVDGLGWQAAFYLTGKFFILATVVYIWSIKRSSSVTCNLDPIILATPLLFWIAWLSCISPCFALINH